MHLLIEKEPVEVVADIVMKLDEVAVLRLRAALALGIAGEGAPVARRLRPGEQEREEPARHLPLADASQRLALATCFKLLAQIDQRAAL